MLRFVSFYHFMMTLLFMLAGVGAALCAESKPFTVVIDAGHGGHDHGALGKLTVEKEINLAVATRLGRLISAGMPDAEVVYTRDDDTFITLQGRCDVANKAHGDIFVSIHTNSVDTKSPNRATVSGASVYTLGLQRAGTNLDVAMRENSVMKLEDDYSTTYCGFDPQVAESYIIFELAQSGYIDNSIRLAGAIQRELHETAGRRDQGVRQAPFWVLVRTSMPAVLVELDFICNPEVERFLASAEGRDRLAKAIYNGISKYRGLIPDKPVPEKRRTKADKIKENPPAHVPAPAADDMIVYKVQFLTSPRKLASGDARLKNIPLSDCYRDGGIWKYTAGNCESLSDAQKLLREIRKRYSDAFVIKMRGGVRIN